MRIGKGLIKSAKEALAIAKGESEPAKVWEVDISDQRSTGNQEQVSSKPKKSYRARVTVNLGDGFRQGRDQQLIDYQM